MAGGDAGFAAGAGIEIDLEGVLLVRAGLGERNQVAINRLKRGSGLADVLFRKTRYRSLEALLLLQIRVDNAFVGCIQGGWFS